MLAKAGRNAYDFRQFSHELYDFAKNIRGSLFLPIDATKTGNITRTGELWSYPLESPISATVTAANGVLYVATMTHLYAAQKPSN
jgi:hypothetical protein